MTATAQDYLDGVVKYWTPTSDARSSISALRAQIDYWLERDLNIFRTLETGSWSHGTAVDVFSDVDYFVSMRHIRPIESRLDLEVLRDCLRRRLSGVDVHLSRPAVRVVTRTGLPDVELVPAHINGVDYSIPDPRGAGWIRSNPTKHKDYVNQARDVSAGTKGFIRLVKVWRYVQAVPIHSLYLEMRAAKHIRDHPPLVPYWDLSLFFKGLHDSDLASMNDPSAFDGRRLAPCAEKDRAEARRHVQLAQKCASLALECTKADEHDVAVRALRVLFT